MQTLNAMEVNASGVVCWIAASAENDYNGAGVRYGSVIRKIWGRGNSAVITCGEKKLAVAEMADRIGVMTAVR